MKQEKTKDVIREEAMAAIGDHHRCGVAITVGGGKTSLGLTDMKKNYEEGDTFLLVGPKLNIDDTWKEEANLPRNGHLQFLTKKIDFSTYLSLNKQDLGKYKKIYLDEVHSLKYGHEAHLDTYKGPILGLTGTPPHLEYTEKGKMVNKFAPIVYTYITDDAVDDRILNDYKIYIHYVDLSNVKNIENKTRNGKVFYTSERSSYDYWTKRLDQAYGKELEICRLMRMQALQKFKSKEIYVRQLTQQIKNKCLIFANTKDQADRLCKDTCHSGNPHSAENLRKFKLGLIKLMACVHQLSEGQNIPDLMELIVMHAFSNPTKFKQRFGRAMRLHIDEQAVIHLLVYRNTVDEQWMENALASFNENKIIKLDPKIKSYGS